MDYLNGRLCNERDAMLRLKLETQKKRLAPGEYVPLIALVMLLLSLLVNGLLG
ncbi:MAG: hypothetical protein U1C96_13365 [Gallionella sp.]|nr:hypothetical protein [Gallionella sp.]